MDITNDPSFLGFIGALAGTIFGASASILTTYSAARNSLKLQSNTEKNKRVNDFNVFQREQLLELQDVLSKAMRLIAELHFADLDHYKKTGQWKTAPINSELDENILIVNRQLAILIERVGDDTLRASIKTFQNKMNQHDSAKAGFQSLKSLTDLGNLFENLMVEIGSVLRNTYSIN